MPKLHAKTKRHVTIIEVAQKAGVNISTVSRALRDDYQIGPATTKRIKALAKTMGYVPSLAARNMRRGKTDTVTVIVPSLGADFPHRVLQGVESVFMATHYRLRVEAVTRDGISAEKESLAPLLKSTAMGGEADGVILISVEFPDRNTEQLFQQFRYPTVLIEGNSKWGGHVRMDNTLAGKMAVEHLLATGRRRPALVTGAWKEFRSYTDRCRGVMEAVESKLGKDKLDLLVETSGIGDQEVRFACEQLIQNLGNIDSVIVAAGDPTSIDIIKTLRHEGVRIPHDLAVISFDDLPEAESAGLTTIRQPLLEYGQRAAEMLLEMMEKPEGPSVTQWDLEPTLVKRASA